MAQHRGMEANLHLQVHLTEGTGASHLHPDRPMVARLCNNSSQATSSPGATERVPQVLIFSTP